MWTNTSTNTMVNGLPMPASQGTASSSSAPGQPMNAQAAQQSGPSTANTMPARLSIDDLLNAVDVDPSQRIRAGSKRKAETDNSPDVAEQGINLTLTTAATDTHILEPKSKPNTAITVTAAQLATLDRSSDLYYGNDTKKRMLATGHAEIPHSNAQDVARQAAAPMPVNNTTQNGYFELAHRADPARLLKAEMRCLVRAELKAEMAPSVRTKLRGELDQEVRDDLVEEAYVGIYNRQKPRVYERLREEFREEKRVKRKQLDKKLNAKRKRAYKRIPDEVKEELRRDGAARLMAMYEQAYGSTTKSRGASDTPDEESSSPTADRPTTPCNTRGRKRTYNDDDAESESMSSPRQIKRARAAIGFGGQVGDDVFDGSRTPSSSETEPVVPDDDVVESVETAEIGGQRVNRSLLGAMSQLRPGSCGSIAEYLEEPESREDYFNEDQYAKDLKDRTHDTAETNWMKDFIKADEDRETTDEIDEEL